jgi:hypothetical protein
MCETMEKNVWKLYKGTAILQTSTKPTTQLWHKLLHILTKISINMNTAGLIKIYSI